jgi:hypothetical protein
MAWLWIVLGLLAVVGSLTWILPSPMERRQGERRMVALKLGMKVRMLSVDDWVKERLDVVQLSQYLIWTDKSRAVHPYGGFLIEMNLGRHHQRRIVGTYCLESLVSY